MVPESFFSVSKINVIKKPLKVKNIWTPVSPEIINQSRSITKGVSETWSESPKCVIRTSVIDNARSESNPFMYFILLFNYIFLSRRYINQRILIINKKIESSNKKSIWTSWCSEYWGHKTTFSQIRRIINSCSCHYCKQNRLRNTQS